ncbi:hypothetical protein Tco_0811665 [Tanacetum coccineum]
MANQEQIPPQQEQPFVAAKQVSFNLEDIILNTNNEVALLYPEHNNQDYFKCVSDFISKCCLRKPFTRSPDMYKEYLSEFWYSATALENSKVSFSIPTGGIFGEVGVNTFRNAIGAHYLAHSSEYVAPPSIDIIRQWFPTIGYGEEVSAKGTLRKNLLPPRWRLLMAQIIQCLGGKTRGFDQITNKDAIILYSLANGINIDYESIFWEDIILKLKKKQREKVVPHTRFISLLIMHKIKEGYGNDEPGAQPGHKKQSSLKQTFVSSKEATKGGSSKAPTGSKTGHSKKRKEFSSAMDSNLNQPLISTPVDPGMHKEDQQATGGPTSLGVTSEARANPQHSSGMSAFNLNKLIYTASFIIHYESASGNDASAVSTAEADLGNSVPSDFVPQQHGINEGTKNTSYDHLFVGTDPHVLAYQTKFFSEGLDIVLTQPLTGKGASSIARHPNFKDLDSPEDDPVIIIEESDEEENDEIHATKNSQKHKLELEKNKAEAEAALLKSQPSFPNVERLKELCSLPTKLKDILSKLNELTRETLQWELPQEFLSLPAQVATVQAKLKTLDALPGLLSHVIKALNKFAQVLVYTSSKAGDKSVPLRGQADTMPAEGEKNKNQPTISQLFQRRAEKGEHIKKDNGKKAMPSEDTKEESTKSDSDDKITHVPGSTVESSLKKELKKFDFVTEGGEHVHLTKEQISAQKEIEEEAKAEAVRREGEKKKERLIDLLRQDFGTILKDFRDFPNTSTTILYTVQEIFFRLKTKVPGLVSFMRILRLRDVARMTARIALEFAPEFVMSPPIRRKYHDSVAFATGCKRIKNSKRCNRKIRIPIAMWPCRVEEKMTLKEVDGQTVEEIETKIIAKDGTITRVPGKFQGYETSEEEPVEQPRRHDLYGFVDHPQLQQGNPMNEFAPHRLPQPKGNMNGWLIEDEEEVERNEVDSDLESTASSKPVWKKTTKADHDRASRGSRSFRREIGRDGGGSRRKTAAGGVWRGGDVRRGSDVQW